MTQQEFEYIRKAMTVLADPETTPMAQVKILRTVGQIFDMNARKVEDRMIDRFDTLMARKYQDQKNQKLVDILSK